MEEVAAQMQRCFRAFPCEDEGATGHRSYTSHPFGNSLWWPGSESSSAGDHGPRPALSRRHTKEKDPAEKLHVQPTALAMWLGSRVTPG
ncbi:unnamed protein product [Clonostachys rosea]|uniref:Uncharacterized protein n=1 Tax=Bionectria ochroleuca TaxID=29856 RepID=A0ABY6V167_BIOOC|nr:unnamed protein product [Clonostachys rosea]